MARHAALYEIMDSSSGEVLSRHRTRRAAVDNWRLKFAHRPVRIHRLEGADTMLIVEGTWHEPQRPD